jgi:hypothetical protein
MRRVVAISGVAVALVAAVATYAAAGGSDSPGTHPAGTAGARQASGRSFVDPRDAVVPKQGRDYTVIRVLRGPDAKRAGGITTSGEVVLTRYAGFHDVPHNSLLDPVSGHRTRLHHTLSVIEATDRAVTSVRTYRRVAPPTLVRLDRATGRERAFTLPVVPGRQHYTVLGVDGSTVWFKNGENLNHTSPDRVWSVRFRHPETLERHGRKASPTVAEGVLAWVERTVEGPDTVAMQSLSGGGVRRMTLPEDCTVNSDLAGFATNGTQWAADAHCSDRYVAGESGPAAERRTEPTFLLDPSTGTATELRVEHDEGLMQLSDRALAFYRYSYDLTTGTLFDASPGGDLSGLLPVTGPGPNPVTLWPRRYRDYHPTRVLVVRLT